MEKSLVRQFTGFGTQGNTFFGTGTKSGFIRTSKDETSLAKSRIQNLPSYKKDDLSKRVEMVVIFQAIEIQRLSVEIESLRVQLKDSQRQLQNYLSYQIQIKELNQHCLLLEEENMHYKGEIQKLNQICQKMYLELEEMHHKYDSVDLELQSKFKNIIKENRSLSKEIEDLKKSFSEKVDNMTKSNDHLKNQLTLQDKEIQKLSSTLKDTQNQQNQRALEDLERIKQIEQELDMRQSYLMKEISDKCNMLNNLKAIVKDKINETEREKSKFKNLETNFINRIGELQNIFKLNDVRLKNQIQSVNKELQLAQSKLFKKDQEIAQLDEMKNIQSDKIRQLERGNSIEREKSTLAEKQNRDLKEQLRKMHNEMQNLNRVIDEGNRQFNELNKNFNSLQSQFSTEVRRINQDKEIISNKIIALMKELETKTGQLQDLKNVLINLKNQYQKTVAEKEKVTESFKTTIDQVEKLYQQLQKEKTINNQAKDKIYELENLVRKIENSKAFTENEMKGLETELKRISQQKQQLQGELSNLNSKLQAIERKALQTQKTHSHTIEKLKSDHQAELKSLQQKLLIQIQQISNSFELKSKQKSALTQQLVQLRQFSESQSLSINQMIKRIEVSEKEMSKIKSQQQKAIGQNAEKMKLTLSKTGEMFKINDNWVNKMIEMQNLISLLENQNLKLESQNKLLNFQIVETHKIQTMQKRRDSRTSTDSTSLKSFMNLSSMIQQNNQRNSFLRKNQRDSIVSEITESEPSERRIFAPLENRV